jgi:hypothetical protein
MKGRSGEVTPKGEALDSIDFWRGIIDGDGSVYVKNGTPHIVLVGRQGIIEAFLKFVRTHIEVVFAQKNKTLPFADYDEGGACRTWLLNDNAVALLKTLYSEAPENQALKRKRDIAIRAVRQWRPPLNRILYPEKVTVADRPRPSRRVTYEEIYKPGWKRIDGKPVFVGDHD